MIRQHPSDATLIGYAAGTLPALHQQVVAVHVEQCPTCRASLRLGQELGGTLLDDEPPAALSDDALEHTLARLDASAAEAPRAPQARAVPAMIEALSEGRRWRWVGYGIRLMPLVPRDATGTRLDLIRVAPGIALPQHDHTGPEITCVLKGAFADDSGDYCVGDVAEGDVGLNHQPRALAGEECICIIATTGYLRANSLIARLLQPVFGI
jgi:putative transcriptional regulator